MYVVDLRSLHRIPIMIKSQNISRTDQGVTLLTRKKQRHYHVDIKSISDGNHNSKKMDKQNQRFSPLLRSDVDSEMEQKKYRSYRVTKLALNTEQYKRHTSSFKGAIKTATAVVISKDPTESITTVYNDLSLFIDALELFNRRNFVSKGDGERLKYYCSYYWECKGSICAGQQLCTKCRDVGKQKEYREFYFVDIIEISKYRKVLCKRCMELFLKDAVGIDRDAIEKELTLLREVQGNKIPVLFSHET